MTNAQIIFNASLDLMKDGKIGTTGRKITIEYEKNGETVKETVNEPEPIHTFAAWKSLGYKVKKGEKAITQLIIWKCKPVTVEMTAKNDKGEDVTITEESNKMFTKTAFFSKPSQVEPITQ